MHGVGEGLDSITSDTLWEFLQFEICSRKLASHVSPFSRRRRRDKRRLRTERISRCCDFRAGELYKSSVPPLIYFRRKKRGPDKARHKSRNANNKRRRTLSAREKGSAKRKSIKKFKGWLSPNCRGDNGAFGGGFRSLPTFGFAADSKN